MDTMIATGSAKTNSYTPKTENPNPSTAPKINFKDIRYQIPSSKLT
jgi:hypothetical protein